MIPSPTHSRSLTQGTSASPRPVSAVCAGCLAVPIRAHLRLQQAAPAPSEKHLVRARGTLGASWSGACWHSPTQPAVADLASPPQGYRCARNTGQKIQAQNNNFQLHKPTTIEPISSYNNLGLGAVNFSRAFEHVQCLWGLRTRCPV